MWQEGENKMKKEELIEVKELRNYVMEHHTIGIKRRIKIANFMDELIKKEVSEEWVEEKAKGLIEWSMDDWEKRYEDIDELTKRAKNLIYSMLKELGYEVVRK